MGSLAMELSVLKLTSPRKRLGQSARFSFDNDLAQTSFGTNNNIPAKGKATGSPTWADSNRMIVEDDLFTIFEQHSAAIPFKWEATPGTRRDEALTWVELQSSKDGMSDPEQEESSASSPAFSLSPSSSVGSSVSNREEPLLVGQAPTPEIQIKPSYLSWLTRSVKKDGGSVLTVSDSTKSVDEPVCKGKSTFGLKPPPGMHSIKQLLTLEREDRSIIPFNSRSGGNDLFSNCASSSSSSIASVKSHQRCSFRKDGLKALPFLSVPKDHNEESSTTVLGFEEWPKAIQKQEKQEKQQEKQHQQGAAEIRATHQASHQRTMSMPRLSFSFKKKPTAEKENGNDFLDADVLFNEDFGKKGGLRERRPLSSTSSRPLADGSAAKTKNWVFDDHTDFSDTENDTSEYFDSAQVIAEEDLKEDVQNDAKNDVSNDSTQVEGPKEKEKKKNEAPSRLSRFFKSSSSRPSGHPHETYPRRPARSSSVSPAPPPPLALTQSELKLKKQVSKTTASPLLRMCLSNPLGQALLKNVKQLRSFEFHTPRALTAK